MNQSPTAAPAADFGTSDSSIRSIWDTVRRHRWLILWVAGFVVAAVGVYTLVAWRMYDSISTLRIDSDKSKKGLLGDLSPLSSLGIGGLSSDEVETEIGVLRSRTIADSVVERLGLQVEMTSPRRPRGEVLHVLRAPPGRAVGSFRMEREDDGGYALRVVKSKRPIRVPARVTVGAPFEIQGVTLALDPRLALDPPGSISFRIRPFNKVVKDFREDLDVTRDGGTSKLVDVEYRTTDPELAAAVVNQVAETYMRYAESTTKTESRSMVGVLREQVVSYDQQLRQAEGRLQRFREEQHVVSPAEEATEQVKRLAELQAKRDEMQVERNSLQQLLEQVRTQPRRPGDPSPYRRLATFPSFFASRAVQDVLTTLTALESSRSALLVRRTPDDPDVRQVNERVAELELQLYQQANSYLGSLNNQIASSTGVLGDFGAELQRVPAREVQYARLARDAQLLDTLYVMLQTRLKEAEVKDAVDPGNVRIVDHGIVADEPATPKPVVNMVLGLVLGLMAGFTAAFARDVLDTKVRSRQDAETAAGGVPVLGSVPRFAAAAGGGLWWRRRRAAAHALEDTLVSRGDPRSPAAEAYRALRTSIIFSGGEPPKVLVVTSSLPGDGKSTSAANLAITFAQQGGRVLLVDGDLRRGLLHSVLGARREPGLVHVLLGRAALEEAVQQVPGGEGTSLDFLPAGVFPPNPAELLGSDKMKALLAVLRERYDAVVFDAPPLNLVTDAAVLGTVADTTLLVARNAVTERADLQHAVRQLRALRAPIGGLVLNDVGDAGHSAYYGANEGTPGSAGRGKR
ncbi:MAG TPA: polysaccharide biosynthesis tyrosine autokinase [Longimicrobiaceae bacterium]|nr:polysaccharide biosynthesis tyrosine autokinase [Longimicrobiaceae bacterium]